MVDKGNPKFFPSHPQRGLLTEFAVHPLFPFAGLAVGNPLEEVKEASLFHIILVIESLAVEMIRLGATVPPGRKGKAADSAYARQHAH